MFLFIFPFYSIINTRAFGVMSTLEDNAVYFIRSKANNNKVFDIPGSNYSEGINLELYDFLGWGNQRFVISKEFTTESGTQTYRVRPLDSRNYVLAIKDASPYNDKNLLLQTEQYDSLRLLSDKFIIEYNSSSGAFRIKTGASDFTKYLALNNYNTNNKNNIVQKSFDNNYSSYFEWVFEKTTTLGINVINNTTIQPNQTKWFLINNPYSVYYSIETRHSSSINTKISVYMDNNGPLLSYDIGSNDTYYGSKLILNCNAYETYRLKVENLSSKSGNVSIIVRLLKVVYMSGNYDYGESIPVNMVHNLIATKNNWISIGYYPIVYGNLPHSKILEYGPNDRQLINNNYYIFRGHGNPGGASYYNGRVSGGWVDIQNMPSMENNDLVAWISCYGAANSTRTMPSGEEFTSSMARESVVKGTKYGLGWRGELSKFSSSTWAYNLVEVLADGYIGLDAIRETNNRTISDEWADYITSFWHDLYNPILYTKNDDNIVWYKAGLSDPTENPDDGGINTTKLTVNDKDFISNSNTNVTIFDNYYVLRIGNKVYKNLIIDNIYTNIPYNEDSLYELDSITDVINNNFTFKLDIDEEIAGKFIFNFNGEYRYFITTYNKSTLIQRYLDVTSNEEIDHDSFLNVSKLRSEIL